MRATVVRLLGVAAVSAALAGTAAAQTCGDDASGFPAWVAAYKQDAVQRGIPADVVNSALDNVTYNQQVIKLDRTQKGTFGVTFEQFAAKRITNSRMTIARKKLQQLKPLLSRIEQRYGVQPEILVTIWGMETDFGGFSGNMNIFRSLATLAYDCRRSDFFREQLDAALTIVARGDKRASDMVGAWAGEIGQTQFLATNYLKFSVDGDGDGRRDLIRSQADVLASTANFLKEHGWTPGGSYEEGGPNFAVLRDWNRSENYQKAIALMASRLTQ